jgi:hypothetical protein
MNQVSMTSSHQIPGWEWPLAGARAERIAPARQPRWLSVTQGRVWLTRTGGGPQGEDLWLEAGERVRLAAGTDWVIEGWPAARVSLLEERPGAAQRAARPARAGWRAALGALAWRGSVPA